MFKLTWNVVIMLGSYTDDIVVINIFSLIVKSALGNKVV